MSEIHFQIAVGAYVFIGAMGLSFGAVIAAYALSAVMSKSSKADQHDHQP